MTTRDRRSTGQWQEPRGGGAAASIDTLRFQDDDGRLALADSGDTDAHLTDDGDGRLVVDDTATEGLTIRGAPARIIAKD